MRKRLRFWFRLIPAFVTRYLRLLIGSIGLGIIFFWLYPRASNLLPKFRHTQSIGITGRYDQSNLPVTVLKNVSLGLTQIDETGHVYPGIAKNWQVSNDGKDWVFTLDDTISWSDGQPVKASDLHYQFQDVKIEALNDQQLHFQLPDPFSPFPTVLTTPVLRQDFIGTGPYKFTKFKRLGNYLKTIVLSPISKDSLAPNLKFIFYGTEEAAKTAYKLGEVNQLIELLNIEAFQTWHTVTVTAHEQPSRYVGLFFNLEHPDFKEKSVRQALAYSIKDKSFSHQRVYSPIMEQSWAYNAHVKTYEYDLERAKKLWGEHQTDDQTADAVIISTVQSLLPIAEKVSSDWSELGLPTEARVVNTIPENFDVLLVTQEVPQDPDQYVLWHSTQPTNLTKYQSPKVDKLLEDGRKELDPDKRLEIYQDFQRYLLEDLPVIFLFRPVTYTLTRN